MIEWPVAPRPAACPLPPPPLAQAYQQQVLALSSSANASFTSMESKAQALYDLVDRTLQQQQANQAALVAALGVLQSALNEAEAATQRAVVTAALVMEGLGWDNPSEEEYQKYQVREGQHQHKAHVAHTAAAVALLHCQCHAHCRPARDLAPVSYRNVCAKRTPDRPPRIAPVCRRPA